MGPSKDDALERGEKIYKEVMDLIVEKHGVRGPIGDGDKSMFAKRLTRDWQRNEMKLKKSIQELCWVDDCYSF